MDTNELMKEALAYHAEGGPGKIEIRPTKPDATQYDLSLAYSPGVAAPCLAIADDPAKAYDYTIKGNLVAVITNGTAVLGLGDIGPLAAKPVMEGKCMLFKHFSGINAFDIEIDTIDPEEFIAAVKRIAPTFGGINLEDIKAPECFEIERRLVEELDIPVMHDDQHGTAIISSAALLNGAKIAGKQLDRMRVVVNGAGAAAIACARLFIELGIKLLTLLFECLTLLLDTAPLGILPHHLGKTVRVLAQGKEAVEGQRIVTGLLRRFSGAGEGHMGGGERENRSRMSWAFSANCFSPVKSPARVKCRKIRPVCDKLSSDVSRYSERPPARSRSMSRD